MPQLIDLTGKTFGRLIVLQLFEARDRYGHPQWECRCECGAWCAMVGSSLTSGKTQSCGCLRSESSRRNNTTHGMHGTPEYYTYHSMLTRCYDENRKDYPDYGGRGIKVCDRWLESVENFLEDMGTRPEGDYSLDRIDNDKGYSPENCRWADRVTQRNNQRRSA